MFEAGIEATAWARTSTLRLRLRLEAPVDDDDDLLQDVIERQHGAFTPSKSIVKRFVIFVTEVDGGGRPLRPLWLGQSTLGGQDIFARKIGMNN